MPGTYRVIVMTDNEYALSKYLKSGDVVALKAHAAVMVADDDAGWEILRLFQTPAFRPCACGSGRHWAICPEGDSYCG